MEKETTPFLKIDSLTVERSLGFGEREIALRNISLDVKRGEICVFGGESGSGKSILCRLILGVKEPRCRIFTGSICLEDDSVFAKRDRERRAHRRTRVTFVGRSAEEGFIPERTVRQSLKDFSKQVGSGAGSEKDWSDYFYSVGIVEPEQILPLPIEELPLLLVQRLALMRALISGAGLLVCDDATAELDRVAERQFIELVSQLRDEHGLTVVMSMGNLRGVEKFADQIAIFYEGGVLESGAAASLAQQAVHSYTREFFAATPNLSDRPHELSAISREAIREADSFIHDQPASLDSASTGYDRHSGGKGHKSGS